MAESAKQHLHFGQVVGDGRLRYLSSVHGSTLLLPFDPSTAQDSIDSGYCMCPAGRHILRRARYCGYDGTVWR